MPRIDLTIDTMPFRIDSPDYEMCGHWFMDLLKLFPPNLATRYELRVNPLFMPNPKNTYPGELQQVPDWNCDSRYMDSFVLTETRSPADAARKFSDMLYEHSKKLGKMERKR